MNEEIEYAEMLEIPVSTVNVVKKTTRRRKQKNSATNTNTNATSNVTNAPAIFHAPVAPRETHVSLPTPLKDSVIAQVNDKLNDYQENQTEIYDNSAEYANNTALSVAETSDENSAYGDTFQTADSAEGQGYAQDGFFDTPTEITADADLFAESVNGVFRISILEVIMRHSVNHIDVNISFGYLVKPISPYFVSDI